MIYAALALIIIGIIFLFTIPWVGVPVGIIGVALFILWLGGFARR